MQINSELVRDAISGASTGGSGLAVSRKMTAALKLKGFSVGGSTEKAAGAGRRWTSTENDEDLPDPTTLEGPDKLIVADGKVRLVTYMLNAEDTFLDSVVVRWNSSAITPISTSAITSSSENFVTDMSGFSSRSPRVRRKGGAPRRAWPNSGRAS